LCVNLRTPLATLPRSAVLRTRHQLTNAHINYLPLGLALQKATGEQMSKLLAEKVIHELGLTNTVKCLGVVIVISRNWLLQNLLMSGYAAELAPEEAPPMPPPK
jgi:CubicO group peptidase (beta-lactamase class C family)